MNINLKRQKARRDPICMRPHLHAVNNPEVLLEVKYAVRSAASFWVNGDLGDIANNGNTADDVDSVTDVVNENTNTKSRDARKANFKKYWEGEIFR